MTLWPSGMLDMHWTGHGMVYCNHYWPLKNKNKTIKLFIIFMKMITLWVCNFWYAEWRGVRTTMKCWKSKKIAQRVTWRRPTENWLYRCILTKTRHLGPQRLSKVRTLFKVEGYPKQWYLWVVLQSCVPVSTNTTEGSPYHYQTSILNRSFSVMSTFHLYCVYWCGRH